MQDSSFFKTMLEHLGEGVYFVDSDRRILYWNKKAEEITGYPAEKMLGSLCFDDVLKHVDRKMCELCKAECPLSRAMASNSTVTTRAYLNHRDGHRVPLHIIAAPVRDENGALIGAVEVFRDATDYLELEEMNRDLRRLIRVDPLTSLPNRRALLEMLRGEMLRFERYGEIFALVSADIDHFKQVNDKFGHPAGDKVLCWVAEVFKSGLRKADRAARYGGEEFMILLPSTETESALRVAEKLRRRLEDRPCPQIGIGVTASFGVTCVTSGDTEASILKRVDEALYEAKNRGRNCVADR